MAHSCPECGLNCYCGGDIDDCLFDGTPEQMRCKHCEGKERDETDHLYLEYEENKKSKESKPL